MKNRTPFSLRVKIIFKPGQESLAGNVIKNNGNPMAAIIANKSRDFHFQKFLLPVIDF